MYLNGFGLRVGVRLRGFVVLRFGRFVFGLNLVCGRLGFVDSQVWVLLLNVI